MKFADTPSGSAGLIISVFGVASSPMVPSRTAHGARAWKRARAYGGAPVRSRIERGWTRLKPRPKRWVAMRRMPPLAAGRIALLAGLVHLLRFPAALRLRGLSRGRLLAGLGLGLRQRSCRGRLQLRQVRARDHVAGPLRVLGV